MLKAVLQLYVPAPGLEWPLEAFIPTRPPSWLLLKVPLEPLELPLELPLAFPLASAELPLVEGETGTASMGLWPL